MDIQFDPPELVAARHFFNEPTIAVCASSDIPKFALADDLNCELFAVITVPGGGSSAIRFVLESLAKTPSTHPVLRRAVD